MVYITVYGVYSCLIRVVLVMAVVAFCNHYSSPSSPRHNQSNHYSSPSSPRHNQTANREPAALAMTSNTAAAATTTTTAAAAAAAAATGGGGSGMQRPVSGEGFREWLEEEEEDEEEERVIKAFIFSPPRREP